MPLIEKAEDRDRWIVPLRRLSERDPTYWPRFLLAYGEFRAGHYADAEKHLAQAMALQDESFNRVLLASIYYRSGKKEEATRLLQETECQQAHVVQQATTATPYRPAEYWEAKLWYGVGVREARWLIVGPDPSESAIEAAVRRKARETLAALEKAEDDYARLVIKYPNQPRLWIDRGRRLAELGRSDEATESFATATKLAPQDPHVWEARGRAHARAGPMGRCRGRALESPRFDPRAQAVFSIPSLANRARRDRRANCPRPMSCLAGWFGNGPRIASCRPVHVEFLAAAGRWTEAEAALRNHVDRFPDDWWAPNLLAKRLLFEEKLDEYKRVCRQTLDRFNGKTGNYLAVNLGRAALLAPVGFEDHPLVQTILVDAEQQQTPEFWMQSTAALVELRRGDAKGALKRLDTRVFALPDPTLSKAMADVLRALACQKLGRVDQGAGFALAGPGRARRPSAAGLPR